MKADLSRNSNRFIIFSVLFTARAYYPVLAILFVDLGLTLDQFVLLNLIWAATIFLFEVPSGALADAIGRRKLLMAASVFMIIEMLCLLVASRYDGLLLFSICVINRICSGLSEACASGADEALAYDSLDKANRKTAWDKLLARTMRWRSFGFVIAMIVGGVVYDARIINVVMPESVQLSTEAAHRLPVALVLLQACLCLFITWRMTDPFESSGIPKIKHTVAITLNTARWVLTTPITLVVISIGVAIDSIVRNFATIASSYYRLINLPEWTYGFLGAIFGALGMLVPVLAKYLNNRFSLLINLGLIALISLAGFILLIPALSIFGIFPVMLLMMMISFLTFTVSRVLHEAAESSQRATVLSVKGLIFNLGYGLFSLAFSRLLASHPESSSNNALREALLWQVPYFFIVLAVLFVWAHILLKKSMHQTPGH